MFVGQLLLVVKAVLFPAVLFGGAIHCCKNRLGTRIGSIRVFLLVILSIRNIRVDHSIQSIRDIPIVQCIHRIDRICIDHRIRSIRTISGVLNVFSILIRSRSRSRILVLVFVPMNMFGIQADRTGANGTVESFGAGDLVVGFAPDLVTMFLVAHKTFVILCLLYPIVVLVIVLVWDGTLAFDAVTNVVVAAVAAAAVVDNVF
mmetsp:Transcript_13347/g.37582  ORF Transcript_13347/g.37582 Transcript_13347/m.37582 type:complete len:203 (-) Transcript_13347:1595-2203(-)